MTNEEVLKVFLKEHKQLTIFKKHRSKAKIARPERLTTVPIRLAIMNAFHWRLSYLEHTPRHRWDTLSTKWVKLCKEFKLTGTLDYTKL